MNLNQQLTAQQTQLAAYKEHSTVLMQHLANIEESIHFTLLASDLAKKSLPDLTQLQNYPTIAALERDNGKPNVLKALTALVTNLNKSLNLKRPLNEIQITEVAVMLLDECEDYTFQDYVVMFEMIKRKKFKTEFYEGLDISKMAAFWDEYHALRGEHRFLKEKAKIDKLEGNAPYFDTSRQLPESKEDEERKKRNFDEAFKIFNDLKEKARNDRQKTIDDYIAKSKGISMRQKQILDDYRKENNLDASITDTQVLAIMGNEQRLKIQAIEDQYLKKKNYKQPTENNNNQ